MKFTPLEIRKMDFSRSLRGYDPEEVQAFLEAVADQIDGLTRETNEYSDKIVRLETRLADFQIMEKTLQETLIKAEESSHRAREDSQRDAEITMRQAQVEAQSIMSEAHNYVDRLRSEIQMLQNQKETFIKKLKYLLQSQTEMVEILEKNDITLTEGSAGSSHENHS
jgi:cell division initiation protein